MSSIVLCHPIEYCLVHSYSTIGSQWSFFLIIPNKPHTITNKHGNGVDKRPCSGVRSTFHHVFNFNFVRVFQHFHHIMVFSMSLKPRSVHRTYWFLSILPHKIAFFNGNPCFRNFVWHEYWRKRNLAVASHDVCVEVQEKTSSSVARRMCECARETSSSVAWRICGSARETSSI